jgi:hypothetical protein
MGQLISEIFPVQKRKHLAQPRLENVAYPLAFIAKTLVALIQIRKFILSDLPKTHPFFSPFLLLFGTLYLIDL